MAKLILGKVKKSVDELHLKYKLSDEEVKKIGQSIIEIYTTNVTSQKLPRVVILGGQPGAGKSELITEAQKLLEDDTVTCNADDYRDFHPKANEIKRIHEKFYPEITAKYSHQWNIMLKTHCEDEKLNYILETTFSSGKLMNDTIKAVKLKGYSVVIMILAVEKKLSFLGTRLRYESMREKDGYGRLVDKAVHNQKYLDVAETLKLVQEEKEYDTLNIYGRPKKDENTSDKGLIKISQDSADCLKDYLDERDKKWLAEDWNYYRREILQLIEKMINRKAKNKE